MSAIPIGESAAVASVAGVGLIVGGAVADMEDTKRSGDEGSSSAAFNVMSSCRSPDATDAARVLCTLSAISALDAPPKAASRTDTSTLTVMDG